jgi:VIT1/CCC1 family predicted Fe2+/Mn2+ transporter
MSEMETASAAEEVTRAAQDLQSGAVRAAVLGVNDGLVTNVALILGVAGGTGDDRFVRLAGLASLAAGAFSMAVGEYVSMRAQVDLAKRLLLDEEQALKEDPDRERRRIMDVLVRRGLGHKLADAVARRVVRDPRAAVETFARAELGLDPNELGSPWGAAVSSFVTFAAGAAVPLVPWMFLAGRTAIWISLSLAAAAALAVGGVLGHLAERRSVRWGLRQLAIVALAAGTTYLVGRLFHVPVS